MDQQFSAICEQGDLGLWNTQLNEKDNKVYNESINTSNVNNTNQQPINEADKEQK